MRPVEPMKIEKYYFPINLSQVEDLLGKMLTQVEAMNLRGTVEKANKDIIRQRIWKWFEEVQENSLSSYKGCIAPIYSFSDHGEVIEGTQTNRWGYICPNGCDQNQKQACPECPPTPHDWLEVTELPTVEGVDKLYVTPEAASASEE